MKYICIKNLYLDKYDDNGFPIENKYVRIPKGSIWEEDTKTPNFIASKDCVHLDRLFKSKKAKTHQWIEITKEHLETYFQRYYEKGDCISINGVKYTISKVSRKADTPYLISTWARPESFD